MTTYTWPNDIVPAAMQLRVVPRTMNFAAPYSGQVQSVDLMGDYWSMILELPPGNDAALGGRLEALFDRLKGRSNPINLWNFKRAAPLGTARGTMTLLNAASALTNTIDVTGSAAASTLVEGDMLGVNGQLVRVMSAATANASGQFLALEIAPRLRASQSVGATVAWNKPTAPFILTSDGAPVRWEPGMFSGPQAEFREAF